ncbi:efflux RND transporter periplasmic adaptor subunit [Shewanella halotolerans]|uniref:efflux RND transporter periplasmic adaptor subunit n=1 Tax=Shewanella halotolerans TaxID=2864204 RepID=UPI001C654ED5|nr:efflux RND transporter periplasmic adaptor subunit [Shewanella halotolerans]QYJ91802.1 efflux RND transporter periplasmic adaptor subunit [Shewanella halotolerans]
MATVKQFVLPIAVLVLGGGTFAVLASMKKPPEEKPVVDNTPVVAVEIIDKEPMTFTVNSYGIVNAKYETDLVSQVTGEIVYLSDAFVRGGFVKKGQILAKIDPSDYEAALIDAKATVASAKATLVQEKAYGKVAAEEWKRIENGTPTELSLRKPQLAQEVARLNSSEAGLKRATRNLERTVIKAPYDALIESRHIGLGSYVSAGTQVGKLLSTEKAEIRLPLPDKEIRYLDNKGLGAQVMVKGNFAGENTAWKGQIVRSEGVIDNRSRMTYLVAEVIDPYGLKDNKQPLRYGSYITAQIHGSQAQDVTTIARHLVVNDKVAIMTPENTLAFKSVDILRQQGTQVVIGDGLDDGMRLITSALDYPIEGMKLALAEDKQTPTRDEAVAEQLAMEDKE